MMPKTETRSLLNRIRISLSERIRQVIDFLFGYDFFISYSHLDGQEYPRNLASHLENLGFRTFVDSQEYTPGTDLNIVTKRRVSTSNYLVVVGGSNAMKSQWVLKEIDLCLDAKKTPILIDKNSCFENLSSKNAIKQRLKDRLHIKEVKSKIENEPSEYTVAQLLKSFRVARKEAFRMRLGTRKKIIIPKFKSRFCADD